MKYNITDYDKTLLLQNVLNYKYKLFVLDSNKNVLDELESIQTIGNYTIDSNSDIRRTSSFIIYLDNYYQNSSVEMKLYFWMGYSFELLIGIYSNRDDDYKWYKCGCYQITETNTSYNASSNSISTTLSDWYSTLNGTRNGQIGGAPTIIIPNEDEEGVPITIKQTTEGLLKSEAGITNYIVDDIGEFYGMPQNNVDYIDYRNKNPLWNQLPYDLEYQAGCNIGDILHEIVNLYPNCQMYFDIYGNFCFNMVPSGVYDPITLNNDYLQQIIVSDDSESVTYPITDIKNITEVFGADYEVDRYSASCTTSTNIYTILLDKYEDYSSNDRIAFIPNASNIENMKIQINSLGTMPIYYEYTMNYIATDELEKDSTYVIQLKKIEGEYIAYYLGQYQPHALCILTSNINDAKYTKEYFSQKYNCDIKNVILRVEKDSPFTVQKIGEVLDCKTGNDFENILSDTIAKENAIYYNRQSSSIYDTISITTKMIPFLDVNLKVSYKKQQEDDAKEYIVKSIDNNTDSNTSKITMYRFYPLYYEN